MLAMTADDMLEVQIAAPRRPPPAKLLARLSRVPAGRAAQQTIDSRLCLADQRREQRLQRKVQRAIDTRPKIVLPDAPAEQGAARAPPPVFAEEPPSEDEGAAAAAAAPWLCPGARVAVAPAAEVRTLLGRRGHWPPAHDQWCGRTGRVLRVSESGRAAHIALELSGSSAGAPRRAALTFPRRGTHPAASGPRPGRGPAAAVTPEWGGVGAARAAPAPPSAAPASTGSGRCWRGL
eukprot:TRINITY_DN12076_c0_g1_i2.p1 TRINITY_DN12076_c0_g1~~TRINITY_DN12076_c0_g1_i2.p1  ORF type:complete len:263 (+),score=60.26 TRINITY_DN12076_c0_g1_i2:85-789(+)